MNKYHAKRTWSELCQREFDSKKEATRAEELTLLEKGNMIANLKFQVPFELNKKPKITITIDFAYQEMTNPSAPDWTYEDSKGVLTRDTRTKLAWLKEKYNVDVILS